VAKANIKLLDFAVTRLLIKLFRTTNIVVMEECRLFLNRKPMNCSNVLNYFRLGLIVSNVQVTDYVIYVLSS